jgi:hypothetical protein
MGCQWIIATTMISHVFNFCCQNPKYYNIVDAVQYLLLEHTGIVVY